MTTEDLSSAKPADGRVEKALAMADLVRNARLDDESNAHEALVTLAAEVCRLRTLNHEAHVSIDMYAQAEQELRAEVRRLREWGDQCRALGQRDAEEVARLRKQLAALQLVEVSLREVCDAARVVADQHTDYSPAGTAAMDRLREAIAKAWVLLLKEPS